MRKLKLKEIQEIEGGGFTDTVDGICAAVGLVGILRFSIPGLNYAAGACLGWSIGRGAGWF